jgi:hypothetical protein
MHEDYFCLKQDILFKSGKENLVALRDKAATVSRSRMIKTRTDIKNQVRYIMVEILANGLEGDMEAVSKISRHSDGNP